MIFNRLIQVTNDLQIQIHQWNEGSKYRTQFLICATSFKDVTKFLCDFQNPIFLTGISSPIQVLVHGLYNRIPQILIVEKDFQDTIRIYNFDGTLLRSQQMSGKQILDLDLLHNTLYFVDSKSNSIFIYSTFGEKATEMHKIDSEFTKDWYINDEWKPTQITSHYSQEEVIFVRIPKNIVVISTASLPELLTTISITEFQGVPSLKYELTENYLFGIKSDNVLVYGIHDTKHFELLYTLPLYNYTFINPDTTGFQYSVSNHSGFIYVAAENMNSITQKYEICIIAYRPCAQNIRNLYYVIETGLQYDKKTSYIQLAADGGISVDG